MFILYGNIAGWKELDRANSELDIIDTIRMYIKGNADVRFYIIERTEDQDIPVKIIKSMEDYTNYVFEVRNRFALIKGGKNGKK